MHIPFMCGLIYVYSSCMFLSVIHRCFSFKNNSFLSCQTLPKAFVLLIGWQALLMSRIAPETWNTLALRSPMFYLSTLRIYARKTTSAAVMVYLYGHSWGFSPYALLFRTSSIFIKILSGYNTNRDKIQIQVITPTGKRFKSRQSS